MLGSLLALAGCSSDDDDALAPPALTSGALDGDLLGLQIEAQQAPPGGGPLVAVTSVEAASDFKISLNYTIAFSTSESLNNAAIAIDLPDGLRVTGAPSFGVGWTGACVQNGPGAPGSKSIWKWSCTAGAVSIAGTASVFSGQVVIPTKVRPWVPTGLNGSQFALAASFAATGVQTKNATGRFSVTAHATPGVGITPQDWQAPAPAAWKVNPGTDETGASVPVSIGAFNFGSAPIEGGHTIAFQLPVGVWLESFTWNAPGAPHSSTMGAAGVPLWLQPGVGTGLAGSMTAELPISRWSGDTTDYGTWQDSFQYSDANVFLRLWVPCSRLPEFQLAGNHTVQATLTALEPQSDGSTVPRTASASVEANVAPSNILGQRCTGGPGELTKSGTWGAFFEGADAWWNITAEPPPPPTQQVDDVVIADYVQKGGQRFAYVVSSYYDALGVYHRTPFLERLGGSFKQYFCNLPGAPEALPAATFLAQIGQQAGPAPASLLLSTPSTDAWCSTAIGDFLPTLPAESATMAVPNMTHLVMYAAHWGTASTLPEAVNFDFYTRIPLSYSGCGAADQGVAENDVWMQTPGAGSLYGVGLTGSATDLAICGSAIGAVRKVAFPAATPDVTAFITDASFHKGDSFWYLIPFEVLSAVGAESPVFVDELPPGLEYVPGSTYFEDAPSCGSIGNGFVGGSDNGEPTVEIIGTGTSAHQRLTWTPAVQGGVLDRSRQYCNWYQFPPVVSPLTGQLTYWDNFSGGTYSDFRPYSLRYQVLSDGNHVLADGAPNTSCTSIQQSNQSAAIGTPGFMPDGQTSCVDVISRVPGEMSAAVVPARECVRENDIAHFVVSGRNAGGTDLTNFTITAPIPANSTLASCDLGAPIGTTVSYQSGGSWLTTCPSPLTGVTAVRVGLASFAFGSDDLVFALPLTVLAATGSVEAHVTLTCDTLSPITSSAEDEVLVIGANCCEPDCTGKNCGSDGCDGSCGPWAGGCDGMASPGECQLAAGCTAQGVCAYASSPGGTACGDPTADQCSAPDSCDGTGACMDNDLTADGDGDGTPDCRDRCPADPDKTTEGACGCGVEDSDADADGISDCEDRCVSAQSCAPVPFYLTVRTPAGQHQVACTFDGQNISCAATNGVADLTPVTELTSCE